ncbi:MAG TPA: SDR family NAD(P)-dependent oxidoreductase [Candidatus Coprenecus merdipullorum]|nr:SDR family NAD(P)-dependent oxidoreductase [Candidatus Coprenecus merdipullorum]
MEIKNHNKYALVTGGSSGMGLEYVKLLAQKGYNVIVVALFQEETDGVVRRMEELHPELDFLSIGIDLSAPDAPKRVCDIVSRQRPGAEVEVLINNAGLLHARHFRNITPEQVSSIIMVHNHATALLCSYYLPDMLERHRGYIMNISSLAAWFPFPFLTTYASTKSFTRIFTRALRTECRKTGVNVCSIYFGAVDTPLVGLSPRLSRIARHIGVMIRPETAARKALNMMFRGRSGRIPGLVNKIAWLVAPLLRPCIIGPVERTVTRKWNLK